MQWRKIKDYDNYSASNTGLIRNDKTGRILKQTIDKIGYGYINLSKYGKSRQFKTHTLIWDTFGKSPRDGFKLQVDHIDEDKTNNNIDNLQLLTARENTAKHHSMQRSLPTGVCRWKNKFRAQLYADGRTYALGSYYTIEKAEQAYLDKLDLIEINKDFRR